MIIGYIALGEDGRPYRPMLGSGFRARRKPITVYQTKTTAKYFSPIGKAKPVYIEEEDL